MRIEQTEILIIGAGPSGSVAAGLLRKQGRQVLIIEKEVFPRFSIGESLLPQSMEYIEAAGFLQDVIEAGFQHKNGAAFVRGEQATTFDFRDKFSQGWGTTYQVQRGHFDHILAKGAEKAGAVIRYQEQVTAINLDGDHPLVTVQSAAETYQISARFLLDASGFGRILPRLLQLEIPSSFPVRGAYFTHIEDHISKNDFDRNKILISVHPEHHDVWFWTIPFSNGRCSQGVVARPEFLERYQGNETERLQAIIAEVPTLSTVLKNAVWDTPARQLRGYSANVSTLHGKGFALLGNAGEFLDPVFSSGVTIAVKSAALAAAAIEREFAGEAVNWQSDYADPLKKGVDAFKTFVESWYEGGFQDVIFHQEQSSDIRRMISAILAGYAWDLNNPYIEQPRRLKTLEQLCEA
ncbi:NAD(P)/FAD-dependent oxidoreductase [Iodobacter ciconiae]|uniref:NAD(P)/FAD-dependent oxidoreductase n=1 Tax=Iodobacter ciconiae TaxID=2496266 RepID=A0A3S8ZS36_9NEIS|nr:NAD(P)/FAD-dependent oxidoreductase [Iodobacter ciconiae]AZN36313.1 NAD(P)/FAD-dependent oxidoreductase [Iodobacter ciconiae]